MYLMNNILNPSWESLRFYLISNLLDICISCFDSLYKIPKHVFNFYLFIVIDNYFIDQSVIIDNNNRTCF